MMEKDSLKELSQQEKQPGIWERALNIVGQQRSHCKRTSPQTSILRRDPGELVEVEVGLPKDSPLASGCVMVDPRKDR